MRITRRPGVLFAILLSASLLTSCDDDTAPIGTPTVTNGVAPVESATPATPPPPAEIPAAGGVVSVKPGQTWKAPKDHCNVQGIALSGQASKSYQLVPPGDAMAACQTDKAALTAKAQQNAEDQCKTYCAQKAPQCKWYMINFGQDADHRCLIGHQNPPYSAGGIWITPPPDEVGGISRTAVQFCWCFK